MSEDLVNDIKNAVSVINDPHMGVSIVEMGIVQDIIVNNGMIVVLREKTFYTMRIFKAATFIKCKNTGNVSCSHYHLSIFF